MCVVSDGGSVGEGLVGRTPVGKKQGPGALGLPMQKGGSVRVTHSPAAFPHLHSGGVAAPGPGSTCAGWGVEGGRTEVSKLAKAWPLPISDSLKALPSLYIQSQAATGVDEKEKLLDEKKFKKKVSEIFKLESDIIETAAHGSVHSNLFKLDA